MKSYVLTTNTSTTPFLPPNYDDYGATYEVYLSGSFGGGTIGIEVSPDNVTWFQIGSGITAKSRTLVPVYSGCAMRLTMTGGTAQSVGAFICGTGA